MGLTPDLYADQPPSSELDDVVTIETIEKGAADAAAARAFSDQALQTVIDSSLTGLRAGPVEAPSGPTNLIITPSGAVAETRPDGSASIVDPDD